MEGFRRSVSVPNETLENMSTAHLQAFDPKGVKYWTDARCALRHDLNEFHTAVLSQYDLTLNTCASLWSTHPQVMGRLVPSFQISFGYLYEHLEKFMETEKIREFEWIKSMISLDRGNTDEYRRIMVHCYIAGRDKDTFSQMDHFWELFLSFIKQVNAECVY